MIGVPNGTALEPIWSNLPMNKSSGFRSLGGSSLDGQVSRKRLESRSPPKELLTVGKYAAILPSCLNVFLGAS